ncbi:MAG TPA: competence/damage-inducible protein A, partial [Caldithrix sp.]|nr:competence/damage-inducible protein A [Caldithrix sp.]
MQAEIISIGNELLSGLTVNSNASFISQQLFEIGIRVGWVQTVGDDAGAIRAALQTALDRSGVILLTGGLGPTHDDITKKVIADYFGSKMVMNPEILKEVEAKFARRGIPMPEI